MNNKEFEKQLLNEKHELDKSKESQYQCQGCEPVNDEEAYKKRIQAIKAIFAEKNIDPAEYLAYAFEFKHWAEKYAYKWFWDRADDVTEEEEESMYRSSDISLFDEVLARKEANHEKIMKFYNERAKEILRHFDWNFEDDVDLWEEINIKPEW